MAETALAPVPAPLALPPLTEQRLGNGLVVVAAEQPHAPLASFCLAFRAGSARDPRGKSGLADFVVELLRRGTRRRAASAIDEALELMGVDLRLETSPDSTVITATLPVEHLEPAMALVAELLRAPAFPPKEVIAARRRTLALLATDLDDPATLASEAICRAALGKHPYAHSGRGTRRDVATFGRADCVAWHERWIRPDGTTLVVAGDLPGSAAIELARALFEGWSGPQTVERPVPPVATIAGKPILLVDKPEANQAQIRLASNGPERLYPKLVAARLSSQMLGGSFASRLMDAIRVSRGLSYGVSSYFTETEAGGLFVVSSYTETRSVRELIDVALEEARLYREEGPSQDELARAKRYTNGLFPLSLETVDQLARALVEMKRFGRGADWLERYRERVLEVSAEEARTQAQRFFLGAGWAAAVVGEAKALLPALEGL
ncbi:MAG: insulinase family protein, partial [Deltaproteobacteria bacterium]|nr:insulinase family protein [Deltaproteobacteria bacterium]